MQSFPSSVYSQLPSATTVFIVVSGDIAQSGKAEEYTSALKFFKMIRDEIRSEKDIPVEFVIAPGNHDCNFSGEQSVRSSVLKDIPNHEHNMPVGLIDEASKVQESYRAFRTDLISQDSLILEETLWAVQAFTVEGKNIWFDSLNASWMSSKHEQQGGIIFPFGAYREFKPGDADLRIGVMHHPLNWFQQGNYQQFKTFFQSLEDLIFTGHEHEGNASLKIEAQSGECAHVEGCALQTKFSGTSEFNVVTIDVQVQQFCCEKFIFSEERYIGRGSGNWFPMRALPKRTTGEFQLTDSFAQILKDPGATLRHPDRTNLNLDDFYVFPDIDAPSGPRKQRTKLSALANRKSSRSLTLIQSLDTDVLLEGDDNAGKTRLLFQLFSSFHGQGYLPLYLDARRVKNTSDEKLTKLLSSIVMEQYGEKSLTAFLQSKGNKKILLVDDFDMSPLNNEAKELFHNYFQTGFDRRIMTVGSSFEIAETVKSSKLAFLGSYVHYRILPLGYERRGELVRKWNSLGNTEVTTNNQWLQACYQIERLIEAARLQHVATTVPIMVLSLLQANSSGVSKDMHNSSFAHYFYFLIIGALQHAGVRTDDFARYIAFGTHLSWFVKGNGSDFEISEDQFRKFCEEYSKGWTKTNATEMLHTLITARILDMRGDIIRFAYQYTYYYFLGQYTSLFIKTDDVKGYLEYCMQNLYVRECANTLLFLAHHSKDDYVVDSVIAALGTHFKHRTPATFSRDDVKAVAQLISGAPALAYKARDPIENRSKLHRIQDQMDDGHDGLSDAPTPPERENNLIEELVSLGKTIEIAGIVLTNQFAGLSREKKNSSIDLIFQAGLRVISDFFSFIETDPERLVQEVASRVQTHRRELLKSEAEAEAREAVAWLIRLVSASWIMKAGQHVNSQDLRDNVADVIGNSPSMAMRLIQIGQLLDGPGRLPRAAIQGVIREEHTNPCVMSTLQLLILNRLYMYDTHHEDKHWAISTFELAGNQGRLSAVERKRRMQERSTSLLH